MSKSLHPNLARIAVAYDEIVARQTRGEVTPGQAQREVEALVARDDNGVRWSINPSTGRWQYRTWSGQLANADPPGEGIPAATPWQMGTGTTGDPDDSIDFTSQHQPGATPSTSSPARTSGMAWAVATALVAVALLAVAARLLLP